jgi:hypothetical protein
MTVMFASVWQVNGFVSVSIGILLGQYKHSGRADTLI